MNKILLVNGPNLNLLGVREKEKYGEMSFESLIKDLKKDAASKKLELKDFQSNHEGALIDFIQAEGRTAAAMVINPGGFTHTSVALRDAILAVSLPFVEVHITNIYQREEFRARSYFKDISIGQIVGLGTYGYFLALSFIEQKIEKGESFRP